MTMSQAQAFPRLVEHLKKVTQDPNMILDTILLESFSQSVTDRLSMDGERMLLLHHLSELLPTLQQDPSPATSLVSRLIDVPDFSFKKVLEIDPKVDFVAGLRSQSIPINAVTVDLLRTTTSNVGSGEILATMNDVVYELIQQLLLTDEASLNSKIESLLDTLLTDSGHRSQLIWRRFLGDRDIYHTFFRNCSLKSPVNLSHVRIDHTPDGKTLSQKKKTTAQSRLLSLISKIDDPQLRQSHHPDIEKAYGANSLLDFAVNKMVDYKFDVLMHLNLMQFFSEWLWESVWKDRAFKDKTQEPLPLDMSPALHYLQASGLHARTVSYYHSPTNSDSFDSRVLYSQAAHYLQVYYIQHPEHAMAKHSYLLHRTLARISMVLQDTPSADLALRPPIDLKLLVALPHAALLLQQQHTSSNTPVYLQLPCASNSAAVFDTLASLFNGRHPVKWGEEPSEIPRVVLRKGPAAARALYFLYLKKYPTLWSHVVKSAETLALREAAVAANNLIYHFITAEWDIIKETTFHDSEDGPEPYIKSEQQLSNICGRPLPPSPTLAILSSPALETIIPYLLRPAQTATNLGTGGKGDLLKAVNTVANIRFDALFMLYQNVSEHAEKYGAEPAWGDILKQMKKKLDQGKWADFSGVGGSIATMEQ